MGNTRFVWPMLSVILLFAAVSTLAADSLAAERSELTSPDGRLKIQVNVRDGEVLYRVLRDDCVFIEDSPLRLELEGIAAPRWAQFEARRSHCDDSWRPVWGKRKEVRNRYNELHLALTAAELVSRRMDIVFRSYDDGIAFRYLLKPAPNGGARQAKVAKDLTEFRFAKDCPAWYYNGEHPNIGPELFSETDGVRRWPMTIQAGEKFYAAVTEAAIEDFSWMQLVSTKQSRTFTAKIWPSVVETPFATPWRVVMVGDTPGSLIDSDLLVNLNPPCAIDDPSWITPGVSFWDWRAWGHQAGDFVYGLDMPSWRRFVDLAAESGVPHLLLDADWYGPEFSEDSDPATTAKGVPELIRYANSRGIGVFLYLNDVGANAYGLDKILALYAEWGAVGIKYGFMREPDGQGKVNKTRRIIRLCAKHKLMCDFHDGPVPPSGETRTWPNCVTREFCHSQSDAKRAYSPETFNTQIYVNMLAGPLDMCNGLFDLENSCVQRPKIFEEVHSTIVAEAARTLIAYSGLTVLPDSADSYREHRKLFEFIAAQKLPWDESRTLAGEIGRYTVMMRRTGDTVLVASATNEEARTLSIPLDFLGPGRYEATFYEDAADAHYIKNREAYNIRSAIVTATDVVEAKMAPGGGHCIKLTPVAKTGE